MTKTILAALALTGLLPAVSPLLPAVSPPLLAQQPQPEPGSAPFSRMHTLLQRTLLKVDVLTVDICFDSATARQLTPFAVRARLSGAAADSLARVALGGEQARARVEFLRDVSLAQFLDGVREDLRQAVKAGLLTGADYRVLDAGLPGWYAALERRGIRKGDQIIYDMGPDAVRTSFLRREGAPPIEHSVRGRGLRNSPLATWLARGSSFRPGLLDSLRGEGARARAGSPGSCIAS